MTTMFFRRYARYSDQAFGRQRREVTKRSRFPRLGP
ncbi:hypothetical protein BN12_1050012 [Nostocoides japonicum T1-X7]|uniref:Uncharacterized protein n=1 Tax=Nostocoides japonicum T1-X7 TaxID=1194083 RepID=A0A077LSP6_9MICO|nr:hypothetical protein BN12_1050012 [Tetrasphaera japonica T1-X7]